MAMRKPIVLGLTWRKFSNPSNDCDENDSESPATRRNRSKSSKQTDAQPQGATGTVGLRRTLSRMQSVRDAFGTLRQKIRTSTRRRKRLVNASPYTPKRRASAANTPLSSVQRRSARIAQREEKLFTPFEVDTPSKTPSKIRMGVHEPKRFNFSSPGQLYRDVNSVTDGIRALSDMSDRLNHVADRRSGIRTTPNATPQRNRRKPIFV